mgnify:CR=1 FL=1
MREVLGRVKGVPDSERVRTQLAIEAATVGPIKTQYDALVSSVTGAGEDPDALVAEFLTAGVGQQVTHRERALALGLDPEDPETRTPAQRRPDRRGWVAGGSRRRPRRE